MDSHEMLVARFERALDLPAYLESRGFRLAETGNQSREHIAMEGPRGETLLLQKDATRNVWTYTDPESPGERGTAVTFLERHEGLDRQASLELVIACVDERRRDVPAAVQYREHLRAMPDDLRQARADHLAEVERNRDANKGLECLGVDPRAFDAWRFGTVRSRDDVGNLVAEPKPGALWASKYRATDRVVVFVERPIDAVAYERRHGGQEACYIATGGSLDAERSRRLSHLLAEAKGEMRVVIGYGNGHRGEEMAGQLRALSPMLPMERQGPEFGARWAEQMQLEARHARSLGRKPQGGPGRDLEFSVG